MGCVQGEGKVVNGQPAPVDIESALKQVGQATHETDVKELTVNIGCVVATKPGQIAYSGPSPDKLPASTRSLLEQLQKAWGQ